MGLLHGTAAEKMKGALALGEIRLAVKRVAIRGRGGQIKNPDKETKARKEWEGRTVEAGTGAKHTATEAAPCQNDTAIRVSSANLVYSSEVHHTAGFAEVLV